MESLNGATYQGSNVVSIDEIIASLTSYFDTVTISPKATSEAISAARSAFPSLPDELAAFWNHCDGIRVGLRDGVVGDIFGIETAIRHYDIWYSDKPDISQLIPLRSDACGNYDCLVAQHQIASQCVVFWDHETYSQPEYLLAGTLKSYLSFWSRHLIKRYFPNGEENPKFFPWSGKPELTDPWPFDEAWLRDNDARADELLSDPAVRQWLAGQDNSR